MEKVQVFICAKVTIKADTGDRETQTNLQIDCWNRQLRGTNLQTVDADS